MAQVVAAMLRPQNCPPRSETRGGPSILQLCSRLHLVTAVPGDDLPDWLEDAQKMRAACYLPGPAGLLATTKASRRGSRTCSTCQCRIIRFEGGPQSVKCKTGLRRAPLRNFPRVGDQRVLRRSGKVVKTHRMRHTLAVAVLCRLRIKPCAEAENGVHLGHTDRV